MRTLSMALAWLALVGSAAAGEVEFIGFSEDGRHVAFREQGVMDGSGFPWAKIVFIDVAKNDYAAKPVYVELDGESDVPEQAVGEANAKAQKTYRKLKLEPWRHGKAVEAPGGTFSAAGKTWTVEAKGLPHKGPPGSDDQCWDRGPGELLVATLAAAGEAARVLQADKKLPKSRSCARDYTVHAIYLHGDAMLALIRYVEPGFEGREEPRFMGVTARLK